MKNLIISLCVSVFLALGAGTIFAQQEVDTISIDDMAPVLYDEEPAMETEGANTGLYIGIAIVAIVAGVLVFRAGKKKSK